MCRAVKIEIENQNNHADLFKILKKYLITAPIIDIQFINTCTLH